MPLKSIGPRGRHLPPTYEEALDHVCQRVMWVERMVPDLLKVYPHPERLLDELMGECPWCRGSGRASWGIDKETGERVPPWTQGIVGTVDKGKCGCGGSQ